MTLRNLFLLVLVNNILHYINEKVVIIVFLIVFFYILKIGQNLLETEYSLKVNQLTAEAESYILAVFATLKYYRSFFRDLVDIHLGFQYHCLAIKKAIYLILFPLKIAKRLAFFNSFGLQRGYFFSK